METKAQISDDNLIDIGEILSLFWNKKLFIAKITFLFVLGSITYSFFSPKLYTSYSLLAPTNPTSSLSASMRSYSAIAGLAGVTLPKESDNKSTEGIARIQSFNFFSKHFLNEIKLENLLATKSWNSDINKIIYDQKKFNSLKKTWKENQKVPSDIKAYEEYRKILSISQDQETQFVSISIKHVSPEIAQKWLKIIIRKVNESMRDEEKTLILRYIEFLNTIANDNKLIEIEKNISSLLKDQMQKLMLVSANDDYVFKQLEPPVLPEDQSSLSMLSTIIIGFIFGVIFGIFSVLINKYLFNRDSSII